MYLLWVIYIAKLGFRVGYEKERQMLSQVIKFYYTLLFFVGMDVRIMLIL